VHVSEGVLEVWDGAELLKAVKRSTTGSIRKKRAERHPKSRRSQVVCMVKFDRHRVCLRDIDLGVADMDLRCPTGESAKLSE
jgi:hypothetical protein